MRRKRHATHLFTPLSVVRYFMFGVLIFVLPVIVVFSQRPQQIVQHAAKSIDPAVIVSPTSGAGVHTAAGRTTLFLTLLLHGIGEAGDSLSSLASFSNKNPKTLERLASVKVMDGSGGLVYETYESVRYATETGDFRGTITFGKTIATGNYSVVIGTAGYVGRSVAEVHIVSGIDNEMPKVTFVAGDVNVDERVDMLDYNVFLGCYGKLSGSGSCINKQTADVNDDGVVDILDANLLLREFGPARE